MTKSVTTNELKKLKFEYYDFSPKFKAAFGSPEKYGVWFIYGDSGNGKTRFTLQLVKELSSHSKVAYNSLEEGINGTMQKAFAETGLHDCQNKPLLWSYNITDLEAQLDRQRSPNIVIIDSIQYTRITFKKYAYLKEKYAGKKLLIFISQVNGKRPKGDTAYSVMYDANLKIYCEGYRAVSKGRTYGTEPFYTIWQKGANDYWT